MNTNTATRRAGIFAKATTATLVRSALTLEAKTEYTEAERMTMAWISDELTNRMGGIRDDDAFDALLDTDISYIEALLVTFPQLVA